MVIEFDIVDSLFLDNCVVGFDVEVNEEKSGNGRKVGKMGYGGRGGNGELWVFMVRGGYCEGYCDEGIVWLGWWVF